MVNLLPVPVRTEMNLPAGTDDAFASLSVLSGKPADKDAKPMVSTLSVGEKFVYEMPPYSLSVIGVSSDAE